MRLSCARGRRLRPLVGLLDVGGGTGAGHRVTGVDLAPRMVERARAKLAAAGLEGRFLVGDAAAPSTGPDRYHVGLCRHLLWTLPDPAAARREVGDSGAPYVDGAGPLITAVGLGAAVRPLVSVLHIEPLGADAGLWGEPVTDERYALIART
ncbi:class I SAM-dependent methyltransferase [Streptomyces sp. NPDC059558]|uniref:class I SAM-dependent methyltransferase n=1 Tax=Streptomyces sp. NPDC059558 TaxID=3346864 RepID=UPI00369B7089